MIGMNYRASKLALIAKYQRFAIFLKNFLRVIGTHIYINIRDSHTPLSAELAERALGVAMSSKQALQELGKCMNILA